MDSKLQIFVSSTFADLRKERQAAVEAILKSGHIPAGMELFTAGNKSQWETIQRWITDSDLYMLILGGRYGSIEPTSGLSYTELEYDFAINSGKPHFAVVIEECALEDRIKTHGDSITEKDNPDKLCAFRAKVLTKISSFFTEPKDVKLAVLETIPQLQAEYGLKGWVRSTEVPDTLALAEELSKLHAENKNLTEKLAEQVEKQKQPQASSTKEFDQLYDLLNSTMVNIAKTKHLFTNGKDLPDEVPILAFAVSCKDILMNGVTNQYGISDLGSWIFSTLCPKLQTHELVINEKVAGVRYRRYAITKKGIQFFAYIDKVNHFQKMKDNPSEKESAKTQPVKTGLTQKSKVSNKGKKKKPSDIRKTVK